MTQECHQITDQDAVAYNAQRAWHGLGTVLPEGELSLETIEVHAPRFLFDIESRPLFVGERASGMNDEGEFVEWDQPTNDPSLQAFDYAAQVASDDGSVLSVTSGKYHAFSNKEMFDVVKEVSAFGEGTKLESVMTLKGRRIAVILAEAGAFMLPGEDEVKKYMAFTTSHDGTLAFHAIPTSVRVVCRNTLNMTVGEHRNGAGISIRHTASMQNKILDGIRAMQKGQQRFDLFEEQTRALAAKPLNTRQVEALFAEVYQKVNGEIPFNPQTRGDKMRHTRAVETLSRWTQLLDDPKQRLAGGVTAWSALNAITEQMDHEGRVRRSRGESKEEAASFSKLFGAGARAKSAAFESALALA